MSDYDPKVLADAESRVQELVTELERIRGVSDQLTDAKDQLKNATEGMNEVGGAVTKLVNAQANVLEQLRKLKPEEIKTQLEFLSNSATDAASERRALRQTVLIAVTLAALSFAGIVVIIVRNVLR